MEKWLVFALIAIAAAYWWRSATRQQRKAVHAAGRDTDKRYHCVEIRSGNAACRAVRSLELTRFLSDEAPRLPVPGCTAQKCTCRYVHFEDRRQQDRRNPYGQWASVPPAIVGERRARSDRRRSPQTAFRPSIAR